jgi:hypothetical protein
MLRWSRIGKFACAGVAVAIYFGLAEWSIRSYVDLTPRGAIVFRMYPPFEKLSGSEHQLIAYARPTERFIKTMDNLADSNDDNNHSPVLLYENDKLLGPAHSLHADIANLGQGRYSHWKGQGFLFSTSDNSDPNSNGRFYWLVVP